MHVETDSFVRTQGRACDERWKSWPAIQASGLATGNVMVYRIMPSIGNLFITMANIMKVNHVTSIWCGYGLREDRVTTV